MVMELVDSVQGKGRLGSSSEKPENRHKVGE